MTEKLRVLLTGFGPFPGAPFNPTMPLVARLMKLRRPALSDVAITGHIFHVTYATVDRELPKLLAAHRPHALLMFGLASRTPYLRIETRARNAVTTIWPDADGTRIRKGSIAGTADARVFGPHTQKLLRAAQALFGSITTLIGSAAGALIGQDFNGTMLPFTTGAFICTLAALAIVIGTERGRLFVPHNPVVQTPPR